MKDVIIRKSADSELGYFIETKEQHELVNKMKKNYAKYVDCNSPESQVRLAEMISNRFRKYRVKSEVDYRRRGVDESFILPNGEKINISYNDGWQTIECNTRLFNQKYL